MTKQTPIAINHQLKEFISYTNDLLHQSTVPFFRGPLSKGYPVDKKTLAQNAYYATILFFIARDITPRSDDLEEYYTDDNLTPEESYQKALDIYDLWRQSGLEDAVLFYCQKVNDIIAKRSIEKTTAGYALISDFKARHNDIYEALTNVNLEIFERIYSDKTYTL